MPKKAWSYYNIRIRLAKIDVLSPIILSEKPYWKYEKIVTTNMHDF